MRKAIAIDFDGCLCTNEYPAVGKPNWPVINKAKQEQQAGAGLILWTCREGQFLREAVDACERWGMSFDAVNENLPERLEFYRNDCRKVSADEYWDDRAVRVPEPATTPDKPLTMDELREMDLDEWVWIENLSTEDPFAHKSNYYQKLVTPKSDILDGGIFLGYPGGHWYRFYWSGYGETWLAYRRKPEEEPA